MIDLLKKEVKIDRKVIIAFLIFNFLIIGLYYTYSIFIMRQLKEDIYMVSVRNNMVILESTDLENDSITVGANTSKDITINLTNTLSSTRYYRIMHEGVPTGVSIYEKNSDGTSSGSIDGSASKTSVITINNTTGSAVTVKFYMEDSDESAFDKMQGGSCVNNAPRFDHSGADSPNITSNMIPVYYEPASSTSTQGIWRKADATNSNANAIWYDYDNFRWANAVTINDQESYEEVINAGQTVSITKPEGVSLSFTSGGKNVNSANSQLVLTISSATGGTFTMDYSVSSESCCDKLTVQLNGTAVSDINGIGGTKSGTYTLTMAAGATYTLTAIYKKDSSVNSGDDQAILSNLTYPSDMQLSISNTSSYPWKIAGLPMYSATYTLNVDTGEYTLGETSTGDVSSDYVDKYVCGDITATTCETLYKVKTVSGTTITNADVYTTGVSTLLESYQSAEVGTEIAYDKINAFFVWIPKYKYYVVSSKGNTSYERLINVTFTGRDDISNEGSVSCTESISNSENKHLYSEVCTDSVYGTVQNNLSTYAHPSFLEDETGFWIGKFANSNTQNYTIKAESSVSNSSNATTSYVRQMIAPNNIYGFPQNADATYNSTTWEYTGGNSDLDAHPITSMEWGAVAILANSKYGKSGNPMYSTDNIKSFTRVYNNASATLTGRSTDYTTSSTSVNNTSTGTVYYYDITDVTNTTNSVNYPVGYKGAGASTTGTIYGVYDMAGGNYTTVMGVVMNEDGTSPYSMDSKYYTKYSHIPYSGDLKDVQSSSYIDVFRLGDGIKEHVTTFAQNGMWQNGHLKLNNTGLMYRGGYTTSGSLFSTEITNSTTMYDTFTVLKYTGSSAASGPVCTFTSIGTAEDDDNISNLCIDDQAIITLTCTSDIGLDDSTIEASDIKFNIEDVVNSQPATDYDSDNDYIYSIDITKNEITNGYQYNIEIFFDIVSNDANTDVNYNVGIYLKQGAVSDAAGNFNREIYSSNNKINVFASQDECPW